MMDDKYWPGRDEAPLVAECKARKNGAGFTTLEAWLSDYDLLFLKRNNAEPLVVLPWRVWRSLLQRNLKMDKRARGGNLERVMMHHREVGRRLPF
jgi:hypothetical protein